MATVVVTGAAGFIGGHLVGRLVADGHDVIGIDRRPLQRPRAVIADLALPHDDVTSALRAADAVFHLAGCPGVRTERPDIEASRHRDNVVAGRRVLDTVPDRVPVVVTSSSSVYGGAVRDPFGLRPSRESDALRPRGGYARSKAQLERLCAQRADRGGDVTIVRPFTVCGEGQRPDMAIARWVQDARTGRPLTILGSPDRVRDLTDVTDVVEGLVRAASRGGIGTVNLGTGTGRRLADVASEVCRAAGVPPRVVVRPAGRQEPPATLADTTYCERTLGFVPSTDLARVVARQAGARLVA